MCDIKIFFNIIKYIHYKCPCITWLPSPEESVPAITAVSFSKSPLVQRPYSKPEKLQS